MEYPYSAHGRDEQIDGFILWQNIGILIECKDTQKSEGIDSIAKLIFRLRTRSQFTAGAVFVTGTFTTPAGNFLKYINNPAIFLWNGKDISSCIEKLERNETTTPFIDLFARKYRQLLIYGVSEFGQAADDELKDPDDELKDTDFY